MKYLVIPVLLLLAGCTGVQKVSDESSAKIMRNVSYDRDSRTGLCYAIVGTINDQQLYNGFSITWVPCEPLIEKGFIRK